MKNLLQRFKNKKIQTRRLILYGLFTILAIFFLSLFILDELNSVTYVGFLRDMVPHTVAIILVVFFIDSLIRIERVSVLKDINRVGADYIYLRMNKFALSILSYFEVVNTKHPDKLSRYTGEELDFSPAIAKFKEITPKGLLKIYLQKLKDTNNKKKFIEGLVEILENFGENIKKTTKDIYPMPSGRVMSFFRHDLFIYTGLLNAVGDIYGFRKESGFMKKSSGISIEELEKFEKGLDLFILEFNPSNKEIVNLFEDIIAISDLAKKNELFLDI